MYPRAVFVPPQGTCCCHGLAGTECPQPQGCACRGGRAGAQHYPGPTSSHPPHSRAWPWDGSGTRLLLSQGLRQGLRVRLWRGRNNPDAKTCSGHPRASVSLANSKATPITRKALQDAKKHLVPNFWEPIPQIQGTHVTHPCPTAAWLLAILAWDLSYFCETEGLGEPSAPSSGALCHC